MLFRPIRRARLKLLWRALTAIVSARRTGSDAADRAYLARMSDERLERDLGLLRRGERDYRPY